MTGACTSPTVICEPSSLTNSTLTAARLESDANLLPMDGIPGVPDGSSVDREGFLWNAVFDGGCLVRYAPDGRTDRVVPLPVSRPSACTFGGPDLGTLYVTTAQFRLPLEKLAAEPYAGGLLALDVGVKGFPEPFFAG